MLFYIYINSAICRRIADFRLVDSQKRSDTTRILGSIHIRSENALLQSLAGTESSLFDRFSSNLSMLHRGRNCRLFLLSAILICPYERFGNTFRIRCLVVHERSIQHGRLADKPIEQKRQQIFQSGSRNYIFYYFLLN